MMNFFFGYAQLHQFLYFSHSIAIISESHSVIFSNGRESLTK